ncbi:MAG: FtsH protease activity modulator HflK [Nitrospinota bacterium]
MPMDWDEFRMRRRGGGSWNLPEFRLPNVRLPAGIIVLLVVLLWLAMGIYIVGPDERGVVLRFGKHVRTTMPGLNYHWPFPIARAYTPKVTEVKRAEVGFRTIDIGPPARYRDMQEESLMLTGDENIVDMDLIVQYRIQDPVKYLFRIRNPDRTVRVATEAAVRQIVGSKPINDALTGGKFVIQQETKRLLQSILDRYESGLQVVAVQLQDVHPPKPVSQAFKDVASALEDKERTIREADAYRNQILPETRGRVAQILNQAGAYREEKRRRAQGDAARFNVMLAEYQKAEDITRKRLYLETMEEILPGMEKIILQSGPSGGVIPLLPLKTPGGAPQAAGRLGTPGGGLAPPAQAPRR